MRMARLTFKNLLILLFLMICLPPTASAQLISLKTVPVAAGNQFMVYPSRNLGMGGVSIALDDTLLDPFINPAKGVRFNGMHVFGSPTFYHISENGGSSRTLPLGVLYGTDTWFGGLSMSIQQLKPGTANALPRYFVEPTTVLFHEETYLGNLLSNRSSNNMYLTALMGERLPNSNVTLAGKLFWADLDAVDGVDLLYPLSENIQQFGYLIDIRLGLLAELSRNRTLEMIFLHNRFHMTHNVTYIDWMWDEQQQQSLLQRRVERNLDRTSTWGMYLDLDQQFANGWRIGGIFSGNWKSHPKIPNYELMNIPRDPGHSWAFNFGVGLSRKQRAATFGIDFIYEPIWSHTWATATVPVEAPDGRIIPPGDKTVENHFHFSNSLLRLGMGREGKRTGFQLGLQVYSYRYILHQTDYIENSGREQEESWSEWTLSWGFTLKFPEFRIIYTGYVLTGTGRPGVAWGSPRLENLGMHAGDIIITPGGPLTLQDASILTNQIAVSIPIRD